MKSHDSFPNPVELPRSVPVARAKRHRELAQASKRGLGVRLFIIALEIGGYFWFSSAALLMDALSTIFDVASTAFLLVCVKLAKKPPDADHPFGHGRYEPIGGLQLSLLLVGLGVFLFIQQTATLISGGEREVLSSKAWIIPCIALILLELSYRFLARTAKNENSSALLADAYHFRIDALNSALAAVALGLGALYPHWSVILDHAGALLIAGLMIGMGLYAAKDNLNQLVDRIPDNIYFYKVRHAAKRVKGVLGTEKIRIQHYGPDAHIDIDVEVDPELTVKEAHKISQKVRREIQCDWPAVQDVTVHIEPYYPNDH